MTDNKSLLVVNGLLAVTVMGLSFLYHQQKATIVTISNNYSQLVESQEQTAEETKQMNMDYVYTICNESRLYDTATEELCGELLDYYSFDFICQAYNKNIDNHCQVEEI